MKIGLTVKSKGFSVSVSFEKLKKDYFQRLNVKDFSDIKKNLSKQLSRTLVIPKQIFTVRKRPPLYCKKEPVSLINSFL